MDIAEAQRTFRHPDRSAYPELAGYSWEETYDECFGGGALYLAAQMTRAMRLQPGYIVLDLGCGKGTTSIFLARHFGVRVVALDLWTSATQLYTKIAARGYRDRITPLNMDVCDRLPFAENYFDAIFCMNSFSFYGGNEDFLRHLLPHLKTGGQLCIGSEVLSEEFTPDQLAHPPAVYAFKLPPPADHVDVFEDDFKRQHSPGWWRDFFINSGLLTVETCHELADADVLYEDLVLYEHEYQIDPFDVAICLEQIEWGRHNRPNKSLFVIAASKR
jgi:SAM-dependent methyltransferase